MFKINSTNRLRHAGFGFAILAGLCVGTANASVHGGLSTHKEINEGLTVIAAGEMIQDKCNSITPRMIRAYSFAKSLESMAHQAGYNDKQIEEFVEDKKEKARVKDAARAYLISKGLDPKRAESYCEVGLYEIERNSQIGVLLKAK
ncbi:DUF5333 domain-containing protein [Actibacterium lipolyticum]|uniref:DUF5333 domain-containing protein n=1 Tax=Actibacterium lipolyticum TaxID=1524263 RepID=A0A238JVC7_9RHOB|nr:DUF5333 domain-containing protein [Actibacterium lipolyticum]SMX34114.1 hypothetical protein COL8621_01183 [Actibacterium lipolyticum]